MNKQMEFELRRKIQRYEIALRFYADPNNWTIVKSPSGEVLAYSQAKQAPNNGAGPWVARRALGLICDTE